MNVHTSIRYLSQLRSLVSMTVIGLQWLQIDRFYAVIAKFREMKIHEGRKFNFSNCKIMP